MNTPEGQSARRRFFRAPTDVPVTIIVAGQELILSGRTLDIGRGGMRFATKTDLLARQPVVLRFTLPEGTRELLINGRVVMSFFDAKLASYAHGVAFTQYPPADRDEIARYVDGFEPASSESAALPPMKP